MRGIGRAPGKDARALAPFGRRRMGRLLGAPFAPRKTGAALEDETRRKAPPDMKVMLDTDVCIAIVNRDDRLKAHLETIAPSQLRMSAITLAELRFGVAK